MTWYKDSFRRHLADMHIEDWNDEFLKEFDPEAYADNLKKAHIQTAMIYIQSHIGYCNYRSASAKTHAKMDMPYSPIQELVDICHKEGMSVVGYYSCIYNTWAHDEHPEWRMRDVSGKSMRERIPHFRYGFCCPNNEEYRKFVFTQIDEIAANFKLEGMFYDMLFWEDICYCDSCRKRFAEETGHELPKKIDWHDPVWCEFARCRVRWMGDFAKAVTEHTKKAMPGITVEHNYASAVAGDWRYGSSEYVNEQCDYTGGDLYGDQYSHSFTAKYYLNVTNNQPFEYMTARCQVGLRKHTLTKSERAMLLEAYLIAAHHGASFFIDAVDPKGTMDTRVYDRLGKVFDKQMQYQDTFKRGSHLEELAVFYSTTGRYNPVGDEEYNSRTSSVAATRTLIRNHIPVGVVSNAIKQDLMRYKAVIAPNAAGLFDKAVSGLIEYVKNGGSLYFSGCGQEDLIREFFGARVAGVTEMNHVYVAPAPGFEEYFSEFTKDFPMPADCHHVLLEADGVKRIDDASGTGSAEKIDGIRGEVMGTLITPYTSRSEDAYASIHSDPPGISTGYPSILYSEYGKGRIIWSAVPFEAFEGWQFEEMLMKLVEKLGGTDWTITTDAAEGVELITFKTEEGYLVSAVDMLSEREDLNDRPFTISVKAAPSAKAYLLPQKTELASEYTNGRLRVHMPKLKQFAMCEVIE